MSKAQKPKQRQSKKRKILITLAVILSALTLIFAACAAYVCDYYRADVAAIANYETEGKITVTTGELGMAFLPENPQTGLIFYPGGKVEHTAYVPLMQALASKGILCVLPEMPLRLAVLNADAADGIKELYPAVTTWYIGGHSLGGSMAASYLSKHAAEFEGLVLLASYSTADLSATDLSVLSVYGKEDGVLDLEKYAKCKGNLPADMTEHVLAGGNHAYFGMYGKQKGDGEAALTPADQIGQTAELIAAFMNL